MKSTIIIDSREANAEYVWYLKEASQFCVTEKLLKSGDIAIGNLGIERKTVSDFLLTLNEGRLFNQLQNLKSSYPRQLLLIEGRGLRYHLDQERFYGLFIRIAAGWQIPIMHTQDGQKTASCLIKICNQDAYASAGPIKPRPRNPWSKRDSVAMRMLLTIPSVGPKTASVLLDHFGTVKAILGATEIELARINGVGKKQAKNIVAANEP